MWNELTFLWNELTILWNDLTIDWNDLTMERNDSKSLADFWLHLAVATILSSPFFISTEEIVSSLGTLTETITDLLNFPDRLLPWRAAVLLN